MADRLDQELASFQGLWKGGYWAADPLRPQGSAYGVFGQMGTYVFSYDALCHVSFEGITAYAKNLFPKLRAGANGFFMVADYEKYNSLVSALDEHSALATLLPKNKMPWLKALWGPINRHYAKRYGLHPLDMQEDDSPKPGRWYHAGTSRTCALLRDVGYEVLDEDVGTDFRSPIIHFAKP